MMPALNKYVNQIHLQHQAPITSTRPQKWQSAHQVLQVKLIKANQLLRTCSDRFNSGY